MKPQKLLLTLILALFLISSVSAAFARLTYQDNYQLKNGIEPTINLPDSLPNTRMGVIEMPVAPEPVDYANDENYVKADYPIMEISDWFGLFGTKETIELTYHDKDCITYCKDKVHVTLSDDLQNPLSELKLIDSDGNEIQRNQKIEETYMEDYQVKVPDYENKCNPYNQVIGNSSNQTTVHVENCTNVQTGTHSETRQREVIAPYNPLKVYTASDTGYDFYVSATKKPSEIADWKLVTLGVTGDRLAWWNNSWSDYKPILIQEYTGNNWTNYSVRLNITYTSNMNTTFADLRFLDTTQTKKLPYFIESKVNGASAIVYVKTPLNASINTTVYMFYNNPSVDTTSNATASFIYYDNASIDLSSKFTCSPGLAISWSPGNYTFTASSGAGWHYCQRTDTEIVSNYTYTAQSARVSGITLYGGIIKTNGTLTTDYRIDDFDSGIGRLSKDVNGVETHLEAKSFTYSNPLNLTLTRFGNQLNASIYPVGGTQVIFNATDSSITPANGYFGVAAYRDVGTTIYTINNFVGREYGNPEPSTVVGSEVANSGMSISATSPVNYFNSTTTRNITLGVNCTGSGSTNISSVRFSLSNGTNFTISSLNQANYNATWSNTYANAQYNWTATCFGSDGNNATSSSQLFTVNIPYPQWTFNYQTPADITATNIVGVNVGVNISYNWTTYPDVNISTIYLYYKANSTLNNIQYYENGTAFSGYFRQAFNRNTTNTTFVWNLDDNSILPATYNINEDLMENTTHQFATLATANNMIWIGLQNISNLTTYGWYELMINKSTNAGAGASVYVCNSSYTSGTVSSNANCNLFATISANVSYDHCHEGLNSCHQVDSFAPNTTSGKIGTVQITDTMEFIISGSSGGQWTYGYIVGADRTGAFRTSSNAGGSWTINNTIIIDSHLHQFQANAGVYYYSTANATNDITQMNTTDIRFDFFNQSGLPPTAPQILIPTNTTYKGVLPITWTPSISPNGYAISAYNITLYNEPSGTFNQSIIIVNGNNNSYNWNTVSILGGDFYIRIDVNDSLNQKAFSQSEIFTLDNLAPSVNLTYPLKNTKYAMNVSALNYTVSGADNCWYSLDSGVTNITVSCGTNLTGLTSLEGNNTWTIYTNDTVGNTNQSKVTFSKDTINPQIAIVYPQNITYKINVSSLNYTVSDTNLQNCSYSLNLGVTNVTTTCGANITGLTSVEGSNTWEVYVRDSFNNFNKSTITFSKDTIAPGISILYPVTNTNYSNFIANLTWTTSGADICSYNLGAGNISIPCATTLNISIPQTEGSFTYRVYAYDLAGNFNSSTVNFIVNLTKVVLNSPANNSISYFNPTLFSCSAFANSPVQIVNMSLWTNITGVWAKTQDSVTATQIYDLYNNVVNQTLWGSATYNPTHSCLAGNGNAFTYEDTNYIYASTDVSGSGNTNYLEIKALPNLTSLQRVDFTYSGGGDTLTIFGNYTKTSPSGGIYSVIKIGGNWDIYRNNVYLTTMTSPINTLIRGTLSSGVNNCPIINTINFGQVNFSTAISSNNNFYQTITQPTLWSCSATDSQGTTVFANENRTISPNTIAPTITINSPIGDQGLQVIPYNVTLDATVTSGGILTCYYNSTLNSTLTPYTCNTNQTITIPSSASQTLYVFANDTLGNINMVSTNIFLTLAYNNISYRNPVYETANENFTLNISFDISTLSSSAVLVYDGNNYTAIKMNNGNETIFLANVNIPAVNAVTNKTFYWGLTLVNLANNTNHTYSSSVFTQTIKPINFGICNSSLNVNLINFTVYDEQTNALVNSNMQIFFQYYFSSALVSKNLSFSDNNLNRSTFNFCTDLNNSLFTSFSLSYSNPAYLTRTYIANNVPLNNQTTIIPLYLLNSANGVKFYFTVVQGAGTRLANADVQIDRYMTANGTYVANSKDQTDNIGQFFEYLQQDAKYRFTFSRNGQFIGIVEQPATCTSAPCELTLRLNAFSTATALDYYNLVYSNNTVSSVTYNKTSKIVTYTFTDLLSTAHYFRLQVNKNMYNTSTDTICDVTSFTTSGTLICDMNGQDGDFRATGYISRSPERIDAILNFIIKDLTTLSNSPYGLLLFIGWLITITFGAMAVSKGNPSTTIGGFMIAWTSAKFITINPFGWTVTVLVDLLAWWILSEVGT